MPCLAEECPMAAEHRTRHTVCSSTEPSLGRGFSLDNGSAGSISAPGLYLTVKSNPCIRSKIFWSLGGAAVRFFNESSLGVYGLTLLQTSYQIDKGETSDRQQQQQASRAQYLHNASQCP